MMDCFDSREKQCTHVSVRDTCTIVSTLILINKTKQSSKPLATVLHCLPPDDDENDRNMLKWH
jgi:hypothetical protein